MLRCQHGIDGIINPHTLAGTLLAASDTSTVPVLASVFTTNTPRTTRAFITMLAPLAFIAPAMLQSFLDSATYAAGDRLLQTLRRSACSWTAMASAA